MLAPGLPARMPCIMVHSALIALRLTNVTASRASGCACAWAAWPASWCRVDEYRYPVGGPAMHPNAPGCTLRYIHLDCPAGHQHL